MRFLVVCAVAEELDALRLPPGCATLVCGVGPVEAALATARALAARSVDLVVSAGVAGGFSPLADVGRRVIVNRERYFELGREDGEALLLPGTARLLQDVAVSPALLELLSGIDAVVGPGITSAEITTSKARADRMRALVPGVVTEAMEGFAVLRAAADAGVPAIELRGISNRVGDRAASGWNLHAGLAAAASLAHEVLSALGA